MFDFLKRKSRPKETGKIDSAMPSLAFKDGAAALEYACQFMSCPLAEGSMLAALVLDAQNVFGTDTAVRIQSDGNQLAWVRVASETGGFEVATATANPKGPRLRVGQLVAWQAVSYAPAIAATMKDDRLGWIGLIIGTLRPEHANGSWLGDERFLP